MEAVATTGVAGGLPPGLSLAALVAVAALLRFPTLDAKSFWVDEAVTVKLVRQDFGDMLSSIPHSESTPPVYYVLAWVWAQVFGVGESGLRSLSALLGTALVPVAYLAGRELASRRAGLAAAALVAVSPMLVWYSQEARAYALVALLGAVSLFLFLKALTRPTPAVVLGWALVSALAVSSHYFAAFLIVPEAAWLLWRQRSRLAWLGVAIVGATGLALLPLALEQRGNPDWIEDSGLLGRVAQIPAIFLVGFELPLAPALAAVAVALVVVGIAAWGLVRLAPPAERRGGILVGALGAIAVAAPTLLAVVGIDYVVYKNVIVAVLPLALAVAVGLAVYSRRIGLVAAGALVVLSAAISIGTLWEPKYHREDWRRAADAIGPVAGSRAVVVTPFDGGLPLELYLAATREEDDREPLVVDEIDVVAGARRPLGSLDEPSTPRPPSPPPPPAFQVVERVEGDRFTLVRYRSRAARAVTLEQLRALALDAAPVSVLLQDAASSGGR